MGFVQGCIILYRVAHLLMDWVGLTVFYCLLNSAWADGNLAEAAGQDGGTRYKISIMNSISGTELLSP